MDEKQSITLVDRKPREVKKILYFIKPEYVDFWLSNQDFVLEYKRRIECGQRDGFALFCDVAKSIDSEMRDAASTGSGVNYDFATSHKSIKSMDDRVLCGFSDNHYGSELNIVLSKSKIPSDEKRYWIMIPEFADKIQTLVKENKRIDDRTLHQIMVSVYKSKEALIGVLDRKSIRFDFKYAREAIRYLEKQLNIPAENRMVLSIPIAEINKRSKAER